MKILIVEDDDILVKVLEEKLQDEGFEVSIAMDGNSALVTAKKNKPDVILLDLILPKADGLEVLSKLKGNDQLENVPIIILSNLGEDQKIKQALALGAIDYLIKAQHPIKEVVEKIKEYI